MLAAKPRAGGAVRCCLWATLALGATTAACGEDELNKAPRSAAAQDTTPDGGQGFPTEDPNGPPPADAGGLCGQQIHRVELKDVPNIYFVLDASGSMSSPVSSRATRFDRVHEAAVDLVRNLGELINVGAAVFPRNATDEAPCRPGGEVFPVTRGDPFTDGQADGDTTLGFRATTSITPIGGTPTAATLEALTPRLAGLEGRTIVLLATDGGPNCNSAASCRADECIYNIEGQCSEGNCCAPGGPAGPENCIDSDATVTAIQGLAALGIDVYVIGIPGSEVYGDVLDEMALAGGAAQFVSPFYFKVDDLDTLGNVLSKIASVVVPCEFALVDAPPQEGLTNVYLDMQVVPYDPQNGWYWKEDAVVELRGDACEQLKSGRVRQVQIVSGCPTEVAR